MQLVESCRHNCLSSWLPLIILLITRGALISSCLPSFTQANKSGWLTEVQWKCHSIYDGPTHFYFHPFFFNSKTLVRDMLLRRMNVVGKSYPLVHVVMVTGLLHFVSRRAILMSNLELLMILSSMLMIIMMTANEENLIACISLILLSHRE